jgi:serine/threonine protein kinase
MSKKNLDIPENLEWQDEQYLKKLNQKFDPRFGEIIVYQHQRANKKIMCKEYASTDKTKFKKDVIKAQNRLQISSPLLQQFLGWGTFTKKQLCSSHYFVKMYFEYPPSDLRNETVERKKAGTSLSGSELSLAVANVLDSLDYLHSHKLVHGDIKPNMISAERVGPTHEPNEFKLLDRLADPSPLEKAQVNNMLNNKELYMSPQLWKKINSKKKTNLSYNKYKNDIFALGMSMISAANQVSLKSCYKKGGQFNSAHLNSHLQKFKERYYQHPSLTNVVAHLVQIEEINRPTTSILRNGQSDDPEELYIHPDHQQEDGRIYQEHQYVPHQEIAVESAPFKKQSFNVYSPLTQPQEEYKQAQLPPAFSQNIAKKQVNITNNQSKIIKGDDFFNTASPVYTPYSPPEQFHKIQIPKFIEPQTFSYTHAVGDGVGEEETSQPPNRFEEKPTQRISQPQDVYQRPETNSAHSQQPQIQSKLGYQLPKQFESKIVKRVYLVQNENGEIIKKREESLI